MNAYVFQFNALPQEDLYVWSAESIALLETVILFYIRSPSYRENIGLINADIKAANERLNSYGTWLRQRQKLHNYFISRAIAPYLFDGISASRILSFFDYTTYGNYMQNFFSIKEFVRLCTSACFLPDDLLQYMLCFVISPNMSSFPNFLSCIRHI